MKPRSQTFSFFMELVVVILFFAISATICATFIVQAKNKQTQATEMKVGLIEAQNMIELIQAYPNTDIDELLEVEKIDDHLYRKDNLYIEIEDGTIMRGNITLHDQEDHILIDLPFVAGGNNNE